MVHFVAVNFCLNSERIIRIGQYLPKLCSNEKGPVFLTHSVVYEVSYNGRTSCRIRLLCELSATCQR